MVGGGPAGAAAAAAATAAGLDVALFTTEPDRRGRPGESLAPGAEDVLREVFGPAGFRPERHRPAYGTRSAWGAASLDTADFQLNPFGIGWHLDRPAFEADLLAAVAAGGGARVLAPARVTAVVSDRAGGWELTVDSEGRTHTARARLLIDATGRAARLARAHGAVRRRLDGLVAVVWPLRPTGDEVDADATTTVEAVEGGWWYTTPLPDRRRIAAFLTDADLLPPQAERAPAGWWPSAPPPEHLRALIDRHGYVVAGPPRITDAATGHLDRVGGPGWLATGDAAVCFDPLSSQGILTAVLMGREAGRALAQGGDGDAARRYAEQYEGLLHDHLLWREAFYAAERRWSGAPFWGRRA